MRREGGLMGRGKKCIIVQKESRIGSCILLLIQVWSYHIISQRQALAPSFNHSSRVETSIIFKCLLENHDGWNTFFQFHIHMYLDELRLSSPLREIKFSISQDTLTIFTGL